MVSDGGWGWSLGKVGKAKTQKAIKWPPKYIQRTAGGPVKCWKEQVSHCVADTLTKDLASSICVQSLTKRETLQSTQADKLSLIYNSVKMRNTLEICLYLAALLVCLFSANASLETENNEVNVSIIQSAVRILHSFFNIVMSCAQAKSAIKVESVPQGVL